MNPIEDRAEFDGAVKEALRHYTRTDILAASRLLSMRVLQLKPSGAGAVKDLRALLAETADTLFDNPRDMKIRRVLQLTYFNPAPKQEAAADNLGLSFSTYRRYLAAGVGRLADFLWRLERERDEPGTIAITPSPSPVEVRRSLSLIVLPFLDLSLGGALACFADSLAEGLIGRIGRSLPGCLVISRSTAFSYKGRLVPAKQIGEELGVRYLLEGSVLTESGRIRINVHLIDAATEEHLWADCFDKPRGDILEVQEEAVARLSRSVGIEMLRNEARQGGGSHDGVRGSDHYLVMRAGALALDLRQRGNAMQAATLFRQALASDPGNIDAMAGLASIRVFQVLNRYCVQDGDRFLAEAEDLIARAMAVYPDHLDVLKARAALMRARGRFEEAVVAIAAMIERHPGEPTACREMGLNKLYLGETAEAVDWFRHADRVAPNDPDRWTWLQALGRALIQSSQDREAAAALRVALDSNPAWAQARALLAAAEALSGNIAYAQHLLQDYRRQQPDMTISRFIREHAPVPTVSVSPIYYREQERIAEGLRLAGMPEAESRVDSSPGDLEFIDADCRCHLAAE